MRRNATARGGGGSHASGGGARGRRLVLCVLWRLCLTLQMSLRLSISCQLAGGAGLRIRGINMWILLVSSGITPHLGKTRPPFCPEGRTCPAQGPSRHW